MIVASLSPFGTIGVVQTIVWHQFFDESDMFGRKVGGGNQKDTGGAIDVGQAFRRYSEIEAATEGAIVQNRRDDLDRERL